MAMQQLDLNLFPLMDVESALDPSRRVRVGFPHHSQVGNASTATVYFELDPGMHVGLHRDSSEELLADSGRRGRGDDRGRDRRRAGGRHPDRSCDGAP